MGGLGGLSIGSWSGLNPTPTPTQAKDDEVRGSLDTARIKGRVALALNITTIIIGILLLLSIVIIVAIVEAAYYSYGAAYFG